VWATVSDCKMRLTGCPGSGASSKVEVIGHQAIAEQPERIALARLAEGVEEGAKVVGTEENGSAIVAPVESVIEQAVGDRSR
jgi:hypothetical protein